jgi:hypothetical protein
MSESESSRTSLLIESPLDCLLPLLIVFTTLVYMFIHRQLHSCVGLVIVVLLHLSATKSPSSFPRFTRFTLHWSDLQSVLLFTLRWSNLLFTTMSLNHNMKLKSTSETPRLQRLLQLLPLLVIKLRKNHTTRGGPGGHSHPAYARTTITSKSPSEAVFILLEVLLKPGRAYSFGGNS